MQQQQWAALVCLDEQRVANEIAQAFQQMLASAGANGQAGHAELLSLANLTQRFAPQLQAHPELIEYAKNISQVLRQPKLNERAIRKQRLDQPAVIAGRTLAAPATLRSPTARTVHEPGAVKKAKRSRVDIFISYNREEQTIARKLANALEGEGWSVWWDPKLRAGEHFEDVIEKALRESKCFVVMWSKRSVESQFVKDEATYALNRNKLVPVMIEEVELPFRFEGLHTPSLLGWDGSKDSSDFRRLVENISEIVGPPQIEKLLIFLASAGDVPYERRAVQKVVDELNRTISSQKNILLQVVSWENDVFPGYGMDAQALINAQKAEMSQYSLFVGIMWNRLGTPTPQAVSGTVEEFERAVTAYEQYGQPDIWFYFREAPAKLDTYDQLEQRKKVLEFKKQVAANGLPSTYKSPSDFQNKFRMQMTQWVNGFKPLKLRSNIVDQLRTRPEPHLPSQLPRSHVPRGYS